MTSPDLTCKELVELVTEYFEGQLPGSVRDRFEDHLAECQPCRTYLEQMRRTVELTGALREHDISPQVEATLLAAFRSLRPVAE